MAKQSQNGSSPAPKDVDALLGDLTEESIKTISDAGVRALITQGRNIVMGIGNACIKPDSPEQKVVGEELGEVNITLADAQLLVSSLGSLWELLKDRDAKAAVAQTATTKLDTAKGKVHDQVQGYVNIIRGQLGPKVPALDGFGIKKLGGGKPGPRKKKDAGTGNDSSGAATGSNGAPKS